MLLKWKPKNLKRPKFRVFNVVFCNLIHVAFNFIDRDFYEFCSNLQLKMWQREYILVYEMFFLGRDFVFGLLCTVKTEKTVKKLYNLKA